VADVVIEDKTFPKDSSLRPAGVKNLSRSMSFRAK